MEYKRGNSFDYIGQLKAPKGVTLPDISAWTVESQWRRNVGGVPTEKIVDLEATVVDGAARTIRVRLPDLVAARAFPIGDAFFDVVLVTDSGDRIPTTGFEDIRIVESNTRNW